MTKIKDKISQLKAQPLLGKIEELENIMEILRDKDLGCPWDKEQTHLSLRSYLIEECYEAIEAIESSDDLELKKELGDVLLQVVFHAQLAKERHAFSFRDIVLSISEKMLRRHPHVFEGENLKNSTAVLENWEKIKAKEQKSKSNDNESFSQALKRLPNHLPALLQTERIGEKSARVRFDWENIQGVFEKVEEEIKEVKEAYLNAIKKPEKITSPLKNEDPAYDKIQLERLASEIGDSIFTLSQLARWIGFSAEDLTRSCCERFINRLEIIEELADKHFADLSQEQKASLWEKAKMKLKKDDLT